MTISGSGFGSQANSVRFGGTGIGLTIASWSDTSIVATIPAGTTGIQPLRITTAGMVTSPYSSQQFLVVGPPTIGTLNLSAAQPLQVFGILGSLFGTSQGSGVVKLNGTVVPVEHGWSDRTIYLQVPAAQAPGTVTVQVINQYGASNTVNLTILPPPVITTFSPTTGGVGTQVTITGSGFGSQAYAVGFGGTGIGLTIASWSDTSIVATIPPGTTGIEPLRIMTAGMVPSPDSSQQFLVVGPPTIGNLNLSAVQPLQVFGIMGSLFGTSQGSGVVKLNGTIVPVEHGWSDRAIYLSVPASTIAGIAAVQVINQYGASNTVNLTILPPPVITAISPTTGGVGIQVTISGSGFGSQANSVRFGGTGIGLTIASWSDTSIVATIPAGATGIQPLGITTAGLVASPYSSQQFLVIPSVNGISPASGVLGTTITLTGTNFGSVQGSSTATLGGVALTPLSWTDTSIVAVVPPGLAIGANRVVVKVAGMVADGVAPSFTFIAPPVITGLFPSLGPVGLKTTISGSGFGVNQSNTSVSIAEIPLTVISWSDSAIVAMVPNGATSGLVTISGTAGTSNGLNFTVVPSPAVTDVSPISGLAGTQITILGSNFGVTQGNSTVLIGSTVASVSSWSDTQIIATVAIGSATGAVSVNISGVATLGPAFTVPVPTVGRISPVSGGYGTPVTITGTNFGSAQNGGTVTFSGVSAPPLSWTDTSILVFVPSGLTLGDNAVIVTVAGAVAVGPGIFTLNPSPVITSISPTFGPVGTEVVVSGTDLGPHPYRGDRITFGGIAATATSWTATSIRVTVPNGVMSGPNPVIVSGPKGDSAAGIYFNAFVQPEVDSLSPPAGPDGTYLTIAGSGFGVAQGSSTVSVGGVIANPTSWSGANIVVILPSNLPPGVTPVVVSIPGYGDIGSATGFIVQQNPAVSSLSSPSGPEGATVTINGANFGATQGSSTVMFNHTPATIASWSDGAIVVNVPAGAHNGPVLVQVNGADSNGRRFMVGDVTPSISITPNTMAMLVGESNPLTVVDATGSPLFGVTWQISDVTVGSISTDDPATLTASASGHATLTASYNGLSAHAVLNSYAGATLPFGTEIWSIAPNPGSYGGFQQLLQTVPTSDGAVDLIGIQYDATTLGMRANGSVVWTGTAPYGVVVPSSFGGFIVAGSDGDDNTVTKFNGETGQQEWSRPGLQSGPFPEANGPRNHNVVVHPDGTIFTTVTTNAKTEVLGIDPLRGDVKFRIPLEQGSDSWRYFCIDEIFSSDYYNPAFPGSLIVGPDGNVYMTYSYGFRSGGSDEYCDRYWGSSQSFLKVIKMDSAGNFTSIQVNTEAPSSGSYYSEPGGLIPDGQGGFLITQNDENPRDGKPIMRVFHLDSAGTVHPLPPLPMNFLGELILGEGGTAFANDGNQTIAFDINTGEHKWSWPGALKFVGASAGGGMVADDGAQILRFDGNGIPTPDIWASSYDPASFAYSQRTFLGGNAWIALATPVQGSYPSSMFSSISAPGFDWAISPWTVPDQGGTRSADPKIHVPVIVYQVDDAIYP